MEAEGQVQADDVPELVGVAEIAALLGRTRQRVQQLTATSDFPAPVQVLTMGKVWRADDIHAWAATHPRRSLGRDAGL